MVVAIHGSFFDVCTICGREIPEKRFVEKHHLNPKKNKESIIVCCNCGDMIHQIFSGSELKDYCTVKKIISHPKIQGWIKWIRKKPKDFSICVARKKRVN